MSHDVLTPAYVGQVRPFARITIECMLADDRGRWRGTGFGDLVDQRFMVESGVRFPLSGRYRLDVTHGMRQDPMPGLASVGLRLEAHRP